MRTVKRCDRLPADASDRLARPLDGPVRGVADARDGRRPGRGGDRLRARGCSVGGVGRLPLTRVRRQDELRDEGHPDGAASDRAGDGKYPDLLVDAAGTAHVVYAHDGGTTAADTYSVCNLQRGIKKCASSPTVPAPAAPDPSQGGIFAGNVPSLNHDFDGPVPLDIGNQLIVIDRRFPVYVHHTDRERRRTATCSSGGPATAGRR